MGNSIQRLSVCVVLAAMALPHGRALAGASVPVQAPSPLGFNSANASGFVGGGHAGYNWQRGQVVFGFEADLQGTQLKSFMSDNLMVNPPGSLPPGSFAQTTTTVDWYSTLRGRFGIASGPWLFYGTAGLAFGNVGLTSDFGTLGVSTHLQTSEVRTGGVVGAGIEYLFRPNVSFNLLYQYIDLGRLNASSSDFFLLPPNGNAALNQSVSTRAQFQTVMAGFSWHFAPMPSGPWTGFYAGGQVGGAWGNSANASYDSAVFVPVFSDSRLKRDIVLLGRNSDGLGIYSFKYRWSDVTYVGVMAQEVALVHPEAVLRDALTGYLAVDYRRLGLRMVTLN